MCTGNPVGKGRGRYVKRRPEVSRSVVVVRDTASATYGLSLCFVKAGDASDPSLSDRACIASPCEKRVS